MPRTYSRTHQWVAAAYVDLDDKGARRAYHRETVRIPADTKVDVEEVLCIMCRRPFDDVSDQPCAAYETTEHLRGGPIGERAKRKHPDHDCDAYGCTEGQQQMRPGTVPVVEQQPGRRAAV
jgi:hypothetical protein